MNKRETKRSKSNPARKSSKQSALAVNRIYWEVDLRRLIIGAFGQEGMTK
jgi:hypothetical protein